MGFRRPAVEDRIEEEKMEKEEEKHSLLFQLLQSCSHRTRWNRVKEGNGKEKVKNWSERRGKREVPSLSLSPSIHPSPSWFRSTTSSPSRCSCRHRWSGTWPDIGRVISRLWVPRQPGTQTHAPLPVGHNFPPCTRPCPLEEDRRWRLS